MVERLNSYTEISPSGLGVKAFVRTKALPGGKKLNGVEIYDRARYFTVTGRHLPGTPLTVNDATEAMAELHAQLTRSSPKGRGAGGKRRRRRPCPLFRVALCMKAGTNMLGSRWIRTIMLLLVVAPYLCFAIVAIGIDLIWGYTGLSLGQALFFCLGAYAMAMHLALPQGGGDVRPEYNMVPQFMFFNDVSSLDQAPFWKPFQSRAFAIATVILLPALLATVFGFFIFRSRVRGVYFSIITQAVAWGSWLVVSRNEMLLGGTNGLTHFYKPLNQEKSWILLFYLVSLLTVVLAYLLCRWITRSSAGRVLIAVRDRETRLYFAGYRPYAYKMFAFAVAAVLAAIGGMLYAPQMGIITPARMRVEESIMMVIWVAVGGRGRLWGAIFGALLVNYTYSILTSDVPGAWPFIQGGMFLAVVLFFPHGFVGLWDRVEEEVRHGAGVGRVALVATPIVAIAVFIIVEAMGLMPWTLRQRFVDLPVKYWLLLGVVGGCAVSIRKLTPLGGGGSKAGDGVRLEPAVAGGGAA